MLPKLLNDSHQVPVGVLLQTGVRTALACTVFSSGGQIETHINKQRVLLSGVNTGGQRRCGVGIDKLTWSKSTILYNYGSK